MRTLAKPLAILLLVFAGACDTLGTTPAQQVFAIKSQYDIALGQVVDYAEQPPCAAAIVVACADPAIVAKAAGFAQDTSDGLDEAEAVVRSTTGAGAEAYVSFARAALARLTAYLISEGVS